MDITEYLELTEERLTLGQVIKEFRKRMGFSQTEFGEYLGVSQSSIQAWEYDKRCPDYQNCHMLMAALEIEWDRFRVLLENANYPEFRTVDIDGFFHTRTDHYTYTWGSVDSHHSAVYEARFYGVRGVRWASLGQEAAERRPWSAVRSDPRLVRRIRQAVLAAGPELVSDWDELPEPEEIPREVPPPAEMFPAPKKKRRGTPRPLKGRHMRMKYLQQKMDSREYAEVHRWAQTACQSAGCLQPGALRCGVTQHRWPGHLPNLYGKWFCEQHLRQWDEALTVHLGHPLSYFYRLAKSLRRS